MVIDYIWTVIFMRKQTKRCWVELALLLAVAVFLAWCTSLERQQQTLANKLVRLHVVANSDSAAEVIMAPAESQAEAKVLLRAQLTALEGTANQTLSKLGCKATAKVSLKRELFGTRKYETFSLPGGYYDALRVEIGSGQGKNWWCVVYPQLCSSATVEQTGAVAAMGGLSGEEVAMVTGESPEYQFKFKALELLEDLLGWFRGGKDGIPVSG